MAGAVYGFDDPNFGVITSVKQAILWLRDIMVGADPANEGADAAGSFSTEWMTPLTPSTNIGNFVLQTVSGTNYGRAVFRCNDPIDPVYAAATTPTEEEAAEWRICIEVEYTGNFATEENWNAARIYFGTSSQIQYYAANDPNPGDIERVEVDLSTGLNPGATRTRGQFTPYVEIWDTSNQPTRSKNYNWRISLVERGFVLAIWTIPTVNSGVGGDIVADELAGRTNVLCCVQRPVNPANGNAKVDGKQPVFGLISDGLMAGFSNSLAASDHIDYFILRENDVNASSPRKTLSSPSSGNIYRWNLEWPHPNIQDDFTHVIKIPFGLATDRHLYMEEMDLVCFINAATFVSDQEAEITLYGETDPRTYTACFGPVRYTSYQALPSSGKVVNKTVTGGSRVCILTDGEDFV
ncbi:MAG: hypothetical protein WC284_17785 [Candidimonas sp.]